jgi:hypothetical protein
MYWLVISPPIQISGNRKVQIVFNVQFRNTSVTKRLSKILKKNQKKIIRETWITNIIGMDKPTIIRPTPIHAILPANKVVVFSSICVNWSISSFIFGVCG